MTRRIVLVRSHEHLQPGEGPNDRGSSIGITGGDRFRDAG